MYVTCLLSPQALLARTDSYELIVEYSMCNGITGSGSGKLEVGRT